MVCGDKTSGTPTRIIGVQISFYFSAIIHRFVKSVSARAINGPSVYPNWVKKMKSYTKQRCSLITRTDDPLMEQFSTENEHFAQKQCPSVDRSTEPINNWVLNAQWLPVWASSWLSHKVLFDYTRIIVCLS